MKILMVTDRMGIGGAETHILTLAGALVARGHSVDVVSGGGILAGSLTRAGVRHIRLPIDRRSGPEGVRGVLGLRRLCRSGYDVVHAHSRYPAMLCAEALREGPTPLVTTAHWVFHNTPLTRRLTKWGEGVLAVSEDIRSYLYREYGVPPARVRLTVNGVVGDGRSSVARPLPRRVVHVSRLDSDRADAALSLVAIAPRLSLELGGLEIVIVGDGDRAAELRLRAGEVNLALGYPCVRLTGALADVGGVLAGGGVFVGVSRAALEAAANRLPVILAGNEGYGGVLCADSFDRAASTNFCCRGEPRISQERLLCDLLGRFGDEERARLDAECCYRRVREEYSAERMARDAEASYRDAIEARRAARREEGVMLCGYFGYGNAGDEASLEALVHVLRRAGYRSITVLSKDPRATAKSLGVEAIGRFDLPTIALRLASEPQLFCLAGGNLLQNLTSDRSLFYYTSLLSLADRLGSRTAIVGGGIGELIGERARARAARALSKCERIILRTPDDCREAASLFPCHRGITLSCDLAMLVKAAPRESITAQGWFAPLADRRFVAVALGGGEARRTGGALTARTLTLVKEICAREGAVPIFVPMYPAEDSALCEESCRLCACGAIAPSLSPSELARLLSLSYFTIGTRLHSAVMALSSGRPAILVGGGVKSDAFDSAVSFAARELGLPSPVLRLREINRFAIPTALRFVSEQGKATSAAEVAARLRRDAEEAVGSLGC